MPISWSRAAGIGILIVVLGIALLIGCWYCRRRSGYRTLMVGNGPLKGLILPLSFWGCPWMYVDVCDMPWYG